MTKPQQLKRINIKTIREVCKNYIDELDKNGIGDDDDEEHRLYEAIMVAVYGDNIFDWINQIE